MTLRSFASAGVHGRSFVTSNVTNIYGTKLLDLVT